MTGAVDRQRMLQLARNAIASHLERHTPVGSTLEGRLADIGGAFVSLHSGGNLRGCIGHIEADEPLGVVVPRCAVAACSADPRFPPVVAAELELLDIELSLLGPLEQVNAIDEILVGRDGLVVESGWRRGLLLPQVATAWNWDVAAFLEHACRKAALPPDAWKRGATLWRFEAEVFSEAAEARPR
jgi:AmmeMemoRadiSam system protein A